ncbi:anti-sigma factor family protein [Streptomyces sp. PR69]|uniref:anti-sigma factor family protein n=1 Tax=Streptomyces sp. PR69 TaxID=2984950 RepID=UPI002264EA18|nr:zf-HC2 domain-containing protein [Streptomyces sp. PR69]
MSSTRPTPAEQHLGDRLAALVDGELTHDARDRVLAHLATCPKCKAEADAQRRLKSVFAHAAPPPPPEGLLARLQGLPAGPGGDGGPGPRPPFDGLGVAFGGGFGRGRQSEGTSQGDGVRGALRPSAEHTGEPSAETFGHVPAGSRATVLPGGPGAGFRIHETGRAAVDRSPWRGRRFAFAAASAVSFAAIALGGTVSLDGSAQSSARGEGRGTNITPPRTAAASNTAASNTAAHTASNAVPTATRSTSSGIGGAGVSGSFPGAATSVRGGSEADRRRSGGYGAYDLAHSGGASLTAAPARPGQSVQSAQQTPSPLSPLSLWSPLSPNRPFGTSMPFGAETPAGPLTAPTPSGSPLPPRP